MSSRLRLASSLLLLLASSTTALAQTAPDAPTAPAPPAAAPPTTVEVPPGTPVVVETSATTVVVTTAPGATPVAPPSAAPAPAAASTAPQNAEWKEVSHINGQLVPVGQRNDYVYRFRRTNIASNPVGWMAGFYGLSASYAIPDYVAIRGDVNYMRPFHEGDEHFWELGVSAPLYLRRTYQGAFLEPGLVTRVEVEDCEYEGCNDVKTAWGPQVLFGWHWTWDSGFNVAMAAGAGRNLNVEKDEYGYSNGDEEIIVNGYFRIGYAF